ncbi:restriction endonuclease subunit S [Glutamicibacter sp. BSL13]
MSLKPYSEYKDSGQQWLGEIPSHWKIVPLWTLFKRTKTLGTGSEILLSVYRDYGVVPKESRNDNFNKASEDLPKYQLVGVGDLVINKMKAWQGSVAISELSGIVSRAYFVFKALSHTHSKFAHFLMRSTPYFNRYAAISSGVRPNQWDLDPVQHRATPILLPPPHEQQDIADYLDRETAEIDAFIADQEQLIALLEERRTATITQAVTKGLNPDAPMKNSGLEWLGEIPEHWTVEKLSWLSQIGNGSTPATDNLDYWADGDIPWLNSSCVNLDEVVEPSKFVTTTAVKACHLPMVPAGSLLVGLTGQGKTRGMVTRLGINSTINQHIAYVTPSSALNASYAYWFSVGAYQQLRFISEGNGGTKGGLTCDQLGRLRIPRMSSDEQARISTYLDRETAEIDAAITDAREAIALSKERRAAVISAAVTGKIDVRGLTTGPTPTQEQSVGVA